MTDLRSAAIVLAARDVIPGDPAELTAILEQPAERAALLAFNAADASTPLTAWLCTEIDQGRVELWEKRLDRLLHDTDVRLVLAGGTDYPPSLAGCWHKPPFLFVTGELGALRPSVAIVGSRVAVPDVLAATRHLAGALAARGVSVVSGLAAGVDTAAHQGALDAAGHTVAVFGTGIRHVFPAENTDLARRILATGGACVSQFPPDAPPTSTTFLLRNSVIAALADTSVVMSAAERSGSRQEAGRAMRYGRRVLLWRSTLGSQPWAQCIVDAGAAEFVDDVDAVVRATS